MAALSIYPKEAKAILFLLTGPGQNQTADEDARVEKVLPPFVDRLGPVEFQSTWHPFPKSHYYEKEMGPNLKRCFVAFKNIFEPHQLAELKNFSTQAEKKFAEGSQRAINIDPGYVDLFKVVLASGKSGGQKVALSEEVFAHTVLRFEKGKWIPFEWTYPDFREATYHEDLLKLREGLKKELAHRF